MREVGLEAASRVEIRLPLRSGGSSVCDRRIVDLHQPYTPVRLAGTGRQARPDNAERPCTDEPLDCTG